MGGGHFVALLEPELAEQYCEAALAAWIQHYPKLFAEYNQDKLLEQGRCPAPKSAPMLDALFCSTLHLSNNSMSPRELFEVLSRLRAKSLERENAGGVFMDRRG